MTLFLGKSLKNAVDAYVLLGYAELGPALKKIRDLGINSPIYTANIAMADSAGSAIEGVNFINFTRLDGNRKKSDGFLGSYRKKYEENPQYDWVAMQAYDAAGIFIKSLKKAIRIEGDLIQNLRGEMLSTRSFDGAAGIIDVNIDGRASGINWQMYVYENGEVRKKYEN